MSTSTLNIPTAIQSAHFILSSGYLETPAAYVNKEEVNNAVQHAALESTRLDPNMSFSQVWNALEMSNRLHVLHEFNAETVDEIIGQLTVTCTSHPVVCVVTSSNGTATCIGGYDGDSTKYVTLVNDTLKPFYNEFAIELPIFGSKFHVYVVESSFYKELVHVQKSKRVKKEKMEEEVEKTTTVVVPPDEDFDVDNDTTPTKRKTASTRKSKRKK